MHKDDGSGRGARSISRRDLLRGLASIGCAAAGLCYLVTIGVMAWRGILTEWLAVFRSVRSPGAKS